MFEALRTRKPLPAVLLGFFLGPVFGMLYLGRGRLALAYLAALVVFTFAPFIAAHFGVVAFDPRTLSGYLPWIVQIAGAIHCYQLAARKEAQLPKWFARWYALLFLIYVLPVGLGLMLHMFCYEAFSIHGHPMMPALNPGDYIFASRLAYDFGHKPQRGDIVVFRHPQHPEAIYVERIMGLPGEKVQVKDGVVYINGAPIARQQVPNDFNADAEHATTYEETLSNGRTYLILKHPDALTDTTPVFTVPPGNYFMLGDNRDRAHDSRVDIGFVPRSNITARAEAVLWNEDTRRFDYRPLE